MQDVLLFELSHKKIPNPLLFSSKSVQKFPLQNLVPGKAIRFFLDLSATNERVPWPENKLSRIINEVIHNQG